MELAARSQAQSISVHGAHAKDYQSVHYFMAVGLCVEF
jgi:hypothetical protein